MIWDCCSLTWSQVLFASPSLSISFCQKWVSCLKAQTFHSIQNSSQQLHLRLNQRTATCCSGLVDWPHDNGGTVSTVASSEVFPSVILSFPLTLESKPSLNVTLLYWFQIKDQLHIESLLYYAHIGKKKLYFSTCFCFSKKIRGIISQIFIISSKIDMS